MIKIGFANDIHLSDKAPAGRIDDYRSSILEKLLGMARLAREHELDLFVFTGDLFHQKRPNRVSHALVQDVITHIRAFPCAVYVVPGNHDMGPDELESLGRQPLGVLERAKVTQILLHASTVTSSRGDSAWLLPRPYSYQGDADPTYYCLTEDERQAIATQGGDVPIIMVAHGSVLPPGDERPYPYVNVDEIPDIHEIDVFVTGHIHENLGVHDLSEQVGRPVIYANVGSVGRTARTLANYMRPVQMLVVTIEGGSIRADPIEIPGVKPAFEVFAGRPAKEYEEQPSDEIEQFVSMLGEGLRADELSMDELLSSAGPLRPEVKTLVQHYLEEATA